MSELQEQPKYGVVVLDRDLVISSYTVILPELFPVTANMRGKPVDVLVKDLPHLNLRALVNQSRHTGVVTEHKLPLDWKRSLTVTIHPVDTAQDGIATIIVMGVDATPADEQPSSSDVSADQQLNYDPLTGLLNHRGIEAKLRRELKQIDISGMRMMAALADCDRLADINKSFGHAVGDVVIQEVARRIENSIRPTDIVARVSGDKFLILLPSTRVAEAHRAAERLRIAVAATPFYAEGSSFAVSATFAVTSVPAGTVSVEEVLADLQTALRSNKQTEKNKVAKVDAPSHHTANPPREMEIAKTLLRDDAFRVLLQTIRATKDESIVGYELLARGPKGPLESPLEFLRAAMEYNILPSVDLNCIRRALRVVRLVGEGICCYINAMPSTLLQITPDGLEELFDNIPDQCKVCVEISEQQLIGEPSYLVQTVQVLRDLNIAVAIDDVGFGRSSLESLIVLSPDIIKIDRTFVNGISENAAKRGFLKRLLKVAMGLQAKTIAEGVEQPQELAILKDLGVELAQGFYWERPLELSEIDAAYHTRTP